MLIRFGFDMSTASGLALVMMGLWVLVVVTLRMLEMMLVL